MNFMMEKIVKIFILTILSLICHLNALEKNGKYDYAKYIDEIVTIFSKEMRHRFGLICIGDGGRMPYDVEEISVIFEARRRATIEEARELEIKTTERLAEIVNAHTKIRPYLREYPFPPGRVEIQISFVNKQGSYYRDGSVAFTFQARNKLFYRERERETGDLKPLFDEPYEEAYKKVFQASNMSEQHRHNAGL